MSNNTSLSKFDTSMLTTQNFINEKKYCRHLADIYDSANNFENFQSFEK